MSFCLIFDLRLFLKLNIIVLNWLLFLFVSVLFLCSFIGKKRLVLFGLWDLSIRVVIGLYWLVLISFLFFIILDAMNFLYFEFILSRISCATYQVIRLTSYCTVCVSGTYLSWLFLLLFLTLDCLLFVSLNCLLFLSLYFFVFVKSFYIHW